MKTVLITGANRGIGLGHARRFAERGVAVFATARSIDADDELHRLAHAHNGRFTVLHYDAADPDAPAQLKAALGDTPVDLLLANAGATGESGQALGNIHVDGVLDLIRINALAPLKLVEALVYNISLSGRKLVALQSSRMGSIGSNTTGGSYEYRLSKVAVNMIARNLANDLAPRGVTVVALHPGWVKTRMGGQAATIDVETAVAGQQQLFDAAGPAHSGRFFNYDGSELPW
ncbi:SDR family oxidoreductase [Comamonadaceae bacterium G21597-S1]|nr:SDR family oxidoreductase [Comamonadaceae bacterium G21597-S1]